MLARYAGIEGTPPIFGYLQHGWAHWRPFSSEFGTVKGFVPKLVWTERDAKGCREQGIWPIEIVGAPFLYLLRLERTREPDPGSLIAFPHHTVPGTSAVAIEEWDSYAAALASTSRFDTVTVCLHPADFADPEIRASFSSRGMDVACNGERDDPKFILRLLDLLNRHEAATSNRIGTALLYAAAMGRRSYISGPLMNVTLTGRRPVGVESTAEFDRIHQHEFPDFLGGGVAGEAAIRRARPLLGPERLLEPSELRSALGWSGARRLGGRALELSSRIRRELRSE